MNKKLTDQEAWEVFINSKDKILDKDQQSIKKEFHFIERTIDLHGYTLEDANNEIEKFISSCYEKGVTKINIITGKGSRSKNKNDPYQSSDLGILKHSVPDYIKNNIELMKKIKKIDFQSINSPNLGSFYIILKKK